jgi:hypothetical protein
VQATELMKQILEAKDEKVKIKDVVAQCKHLSYTEQQQLFAVLNQFQSLFDGTLGHWKKENYDITLHPDAMQNHIMQAIPKVHEATLNMEL